MKYSEDMIQDIEDAIKSGLSDKKTCDLVGISQETLITWCREKPEFSERIKKARAEKCKLYADVIRAAGIGETDVKCPECGHEFKVKLSQKQWQAIAWLAERTEFEEFGNKQRVEHTGEGGGPVTIKEVVINRPGNKE